MNCSVNIVAFQRVALINIQNGIDIESLSELVFFIEDTVMRKKAQFMMRIVYTGFTSYCWILTLLCRIASATASASLLKATL